MIQDIYPHTFDNSFEMCSPSDDDHILICTDKEVMGNISKEGKLHFPCYSEIEEEEDLIYLFTIDHERFFLYRKNIVLDNYDWIPSRVFRKQQPKQYAFAAITGLQIARWYNSRQFCGKCGEKLIHSYKERMLYCPKCHQIEYPKISPAVIIGLTHNNKILLSKYADREYTNYALLAGFSEIGETLEETVRREVKEEVGLEVKNIRYYKSQPWSFTDTLLVGFFAELEGQDKIILDKQELSMAEWFERETIPVTYEDCSLTNEMIIYFKENKNR